MDHLHLHFYLYLFSGFFLLAAILGAIVIVRHIKRSSQLKDLPNKLICEGYAFIKPFEGPAINRKKPFFEDQSPSWQNAMAACGALYQKAGVKVIYTIHGTFTGDDPLGFISFIKLGYPRLSKTLEITLKQTLKASTNNLMQDTGNFTDAYIELTKKALGGGIEVMDFCWSSENHHYARLKGSIELANTLAQKIRQDDIKSKEAILLLGHSHAGQLFSLINLFCASPTQQTKKLFDIIKEEFDGDSFMKHIAIIKKARIYYVTLGTPPRYPWPFKEQKNLLNIVNHRGTSLETTGLRGILQTKDGDYIQKFGVSGSDLISNIKKERSLNHKLEPLLGPSFNLAHWKKETASKKRPLNGGFTALIDLKEKDQNPLDFVSSIFGHGTYTRYEKILELHTLITGHFFKKS